MNRRRLFGLLSVSPLAAVAPAAARAAVKPVDPDFVEKLERGLTDINREIAEAEAKLRAATRPAEFVVRPTFEKGRYIPPSITRLIALVARHSDVSSESIRGGGRVTRLVNARFAIANLAAEFCPRLSARAVDDGMLRGEGSCLWARGRHADRLKMYPDYAALFERCRGELLTGVLP